MFKKLKWNSDKVLSISAMSISFITLIIFIYQTNLMSKQNYLSILPYLAINSHNNSEQNTFSISLSNHGVGPAVIESVTLHLKGKTYDLADYGDELYTFMKSKEPALDSIQNLSYSTLDRGMALPVGEQYFIVTVSQSKEEYDLFTQSLGALLEQGLTFEIIYRSIQNERWKITNDSQGPIKLD
ncbi:MAG: hypothetical protein ABJM06_04930 [Gilvibacter sp.]